MTDDYLSLHILKFTYIKKCMSTECCFVVA